MLKFLEGGGMMAQAIMDHDWSGHPLGPPETWSATFKTTVATALASRFPQCIVWGDHLSSIPNDAFMPILGSKPKVLGEAFSTIWAEVWDDVGPIVARAYDGTPTYLEDMALVINREGRPENAWFTFCYGPVRDDTGAVVGMIDTVIETTSAVLARQQSQVVAQELVHRIKNALSVAQAIASQTLRGDISLLEARQRLESRLQAMARTQDVLIRTDWNEADIRSVIEHILAPHTESAGHVTLAGPDVAISGHQTLSLALALHELATNAGKYGALSTPGGHVSIHWTIDGSGENEKLVLRWTETGGPRVVAPTRRGFGTQILSRMLPADFEGTSTLDYAEPGLSFTLVAPAHTLPGRTA